MNERIKELRKALDLTQQEFADKIGMKRNTIASYEINRNGPSNSVISLICKAFNVSETWLRTGEGEMFVEAPSDTLDALAREYHLDRFGRTVVEKMLNLNEKQWAAFHDFAMDVLESLSENSAAPAFAPAHTPTVEEETRAEAELFYQQRLSEKRREKQASSAKESGVG